MQALNHMVFGGLVGLTFNDPVVAIPIALSSHFLMDVIPHYGNDPKTARGTRAYNLRIVLDTLACILVMTFFLSLHPPNTSLFVLCAIFAVLPDLFWPLALYVKQKGIVWEFFKFHKRIQYESRAGIYLETVWFAVTTAIVIHTI